MGIARQLYQLQELDREIEGGEQSLKLKQARMCESEALLAARSRLAVDRKRLDGLKHEQHSAETDIQDLSSKISVIDEKLYGGKIRNPKELTDLQRDGNALKARRSEFETRVLELMDEVDATNKGVSASAKELDQVEGEWRAEQQKLSVEVEQLKVKLAEEKVERGELAGSVDPPALATYEKLRKQKGQAMAKIEQGICRGCRISLSVNEIQQARTGNMVQCSSCGRILFLP